MCIIDYVRGCLEVTKIAFAESLALRLITGKSEGQLSGIERFQCGLKLLQYDRIPSSFGLQAPASRYDPAQRSM